MTLDRLKPASDEAVNVKGRAIARAKAAAYLPPVKLMQRGGSLEDELSPMKRRNGHSKTPVLWSSLTLVRASENTPAMAVVGLEGSFTSAVTTLVIYKRSCVFAWGGKACGKAQMSTKRSFCQRETEDGLEKYLQICGAGRKSRKRPALVVGKNPNGKCQFTTAGTNASAYAAMAKRTLAEKTLL